jgi:hypothetical protein
VERNCEVHDTTETVAQEGSVITSAVAGLREIGWDDVDWIDLAQDRDFWRSLVNTVMNLRVPENVGKFLSGCTIGGCSRRPQLRK